MGTFHRLIEWFWLEGTLKIILFQPPCHGQGPLPPHQGTPSPVQTWPWTLPGRGRPQLLRVSWGPTGLGNQLSTLTVEKFFPVSHLNPPSVSSEPCPPRVPSPHPLGRSPSPAFLEAPSGTGRVLQGHPRSLLCSRLSSPNPERWGSEGTSGSPDLDSPQ